MYYDRYYIKYKRLQKGYTQKQCANLLKMDEGNYNKLEAGLYVNIPLYTLEKMRRLLGANLNILIRDTDKKRGGQDYEKKCREYR